MRKKLLGFFKRFIAYQESVYKKYQNFDCESQSYKSLSPTDSADPDNHYGDALIWAINNRAEKNIKNIALTGPYGSGKSSILKTFQKRYQSNKLQFLNISLATFKEEADENLPKSKTELLNLIELSILQQIFYHEEDYKIPDSRFKKIKSISKKKIFANAFFLFLFLIFGINFFKPYFLCDILENFVSNKTLNFLNPLTNAVVLIGLFFILYKSYRLINSFTIDKFKIQNAEIEIGKNNIKSIMNHHIDEILYFFSIRPYNIVIIEDLDRFQKTEIFTKLREINLLLNSSERTKNKNIVFIYAVRDDMFTDKDRTKFFDFIIPIIPVINSSNSSQIFLEERTKNNFHLSDALIDNISLFIDDMRLLYNIINEFSLYRKMLDKQLMEDRLLAIIVYKNINPKDFVELSNNSGNLFNAINSRKIYIQDVVKLIDEEIEKHRNENKSLALLQIKNVKELRTLYIMELLSELDKFSSFLINNESVSISEMVEEENFSFFISDSLYYQQFYISLSNTRNVQIKLKFSDIETKVDSKLYEERKKEIEDFNSNRIEISKREIENLESKKSKTYSLKIKDILKDGQIKFSEDKSNNQLINILLRNDYIAEDYLDYISIFYEGSITKSDNQFLLNLKSQQKISFDYPLYKVENIIAKIDLADFETEFILNFDLVNFLLKTSLYKNRRDAIFEFICNESIRSAEFIDFFILRNPDPELFIKRISASWPGIWNYIKEKSNYISEKQGIYLRLLLQYAEVEYLKIIAEHSKIKESIIASSDILLGIGNEEKIKQVITGLELKFEEINFNSTSDKLLEYIHLNDSYKFSIETVKGFLLFKDVYDEQNFDISNYKAIHAAYPEKILNYIFDNINDYIELVYLKIPFNINEDEEYLIRLLNNSKVKFQNKTLIIEQTRTRILLISTIESIDIRKVLFKYNKVLSTWENLLSEFEIDSIISPVLAQFINNVDNVKALKADNLPGNDKFDKFWRSFIESDQIDLYTYDHLLKKGTKCYSDLPLEDFSFEKVALLVKHKILEPEITNFQILKSNFEDLQITFLELNKNKYLEHIPDFLIDSNDLKSILKSEIFTYSEKQLILSHTDLKIIEANSQNMIEIAGLFIKHASFKVSKDLLNKLLLNSNISKSNRIHIFNLNHAEIATESITAFLNNLGMPFSNITVKGNRPLIEFTFENEKLLEFLVQLKYISKFQKDINGLRVSTFKH